MASLKALSKQASVCNLPGASAGAFARRCFAAADQQSFLNLSPTHCLYRLYSIFSFVWGGGPNMFPDPGFQPGYEVPLGPCCQVVPSYFMFSVTCNFELKDADEVFILFNWDRQKVPKLQLFLLFPLHRRSGGFRKSVCVSSTIFVCETEKWIKTFVRGQVETENRLNTHISRIGS